MRIQRLSEITEFPDLRPLTPEEEKEALTLAKAAFTADDLQKYTEELNGVPMENVLRVMEQFQEFADAAMFGGVPMEDFLRELEEDQRRMEEGNS